MPRRRDVLRMLALGAAAAVPAACGVPTGGRPIIDGTGPAFGGIGDNGSGPVPGVARDARRPQDLVSLYLQCIAGKLDSSDDRAAAANRAQAFLTEAAKRTWQPGSQVTIVRHGELPPGDTLADGSESYTVPLTPIGIFSEQFPGSIEPSPPGTSPVLARFKVVQNGTGWLLDELPPGLLMDDAALTRFYGAHLLYFWDPDRTGLVPDLRYASTSLSATTAATEVVNWLLSGPSGWLSPAVRQPPSGVRLVDPYVSITPAGQIVVKLSAVPQGTDLQLLIDQLRWSLWQSAPRSVNLEIGGVPQTKIDGDSSHYLEANFATGNFRSGDPDAQAYCIANGAVRSLANPNSVPAVLAGPRNAGVHSAALTRDDVPSVALVVGPNHTLWLGLPGSASGPASWRGPVLSGVGTRPVWLYPSTQVLAVSGGVLYAVKLDGSVTTALDASTGSISAFSVSPDGRRIAVVIGGDVAVAPLVRSSGTVSAGPGRAIDLTARLVRGSATGVAWSRLDQVVVSGRLAGAARATWGLVEATIDGAVIRAYSEVGLSEPITQVVSYPPNAPFWDNAGPVMIQTGRGAFKVHAGNAETLAFPPESGGAPASPLGGGQPSGAGLGVPASPFYVD